MTVNSVPPPTSSSSKEAQAARSGTKRRRRAAAGGAADDCFTCIKREVKCDRRRPYCSQCLEVGNECSGYKTQLTWGVGVASRGKLRGLSLPIAKAPPVAPATKKSSPPRTGPASSTASQWGDHEDVFQQQHDDADYRGEHTVSLPATPYAAYPEFIRFTQAERMAPSAPTSWGSMPSYASNLTIQEPPRMHKLNTSLGSFPVVGDAMSSSTMDSYSEADYALSPLSHSYPQDDMPYVNSPSMIYDNIQGHNSPVSQSPAILIEQRAIPPTSCPSLAYAPSEHSSSLSSNPESFEHSMGGARLLMDSEALREIFYTRGFIQSSLH
jgi:hypothetical protein